MELHTSVLAGRDLKGGRTQRDGMVIKPTASLENGQRAMVCPLLRTLFLPAHASWDPIIRKMFIEHRL